MAGACDFRVAKRDCYSGTGEGVPILKPARGGGRGLSGSRAAGVSV